MADDKIHLSDVSEPSGPLSADPIVREARKRFDRASEWEMVARQRFIADMKFAHADATNGYQWPGDIRNARGNANRPCLTMNMVRQHNLQITNTARKNKCSPKFLAMGGGATNESAKVFQDIARNIETQSKAQIVYTIAQSFQVDAGIGYWRLVTDYSGDDTHDQSIFIRPVEDPLQVYMDPDVSPFFPEKSNFCLLFDDLPKDDFEDAYPEFRDLMGQNPLGVGVGESDWISAHQVRVCEYFRRVPRRDSLLSFMHQGQRHEILRSKLPTTLARKVIDDPMTRMRDIQVMEVEWFLIAGDKIIDRTVWLGKTIPVIPVIGEQVVIDGVMDRKGHTRAMLDAQRMYNYNASAQVEFGALQSKTPWVAAAKAIEEFESYWNTANSRNHSVLPFNHVDPDNPDVPLPPPQRQDPPTVAPAYQAGMETAFNQMMMTSGQWQNTMGMAGAERTGAAIKPRMEQGETATFHFQDNYANALIETARQLIDLIPKVYDTKRVMQLVAEDGTEYELVLDPAARQAFVEELDHRNAVVKRIFNPQIGKYDVGPGVGPSYATKRQETAEMLGNVLAQAPALTGIIGDLLVGSMDFDKADEAARRLKRLVPPAALGQGPTPNELQLQQQVASLTEALQKAMHVTAKDQLKLVGKDEKRDIDVYEAETNRMKALSGMLPMDPQGLQALVQQLVQQAMGQDIGEIPKANESMISGTEGPNGQGSTPAGLASPAAPDQQVSPLPGARKAPDGEWYMLDPTRKGKYLHIAPLGKQK